MTYLLLALGFVLLVAGGDALVRGAVALASRMGVSPLVVGLTVVGFGTSTPELVTSLQAALAGSPGIAVGNVVGSNVANILLILGASAIIYPVVASGAALRRDGTALLGATALCVGVVLAGSLERAWGAVLILALVAYLVVAYLGERRAAGSEAPAGPPRGRPWREVLLVVGGIGVTILGARLLVDAAIVLAEEWGLSEAVVGLTVVAVGTSLPELVTSVVAALRRQGDVALGNVVGSNIYNILGILGVTAVVQPLEVPARIGTFDVWAMVAATLALAACALLAGGVGRLTGAAFLVAYVAYTAMLMTAG